MMIQNKVLKVSPATNKRFSESEIRKMNDRDCYEIVHAAWCLSDKITIPIWIVISLFWLMYALDMSTVLVFLGLIFISFWINWKLQKFMHEKYKKHQELDKTAREDMNTILSNVKFLKQYGWTDFFFNRCVKSQEDCNNLKDKLQIFEKSREFYMRIKHFLIPILAFTMFMYNTDATTGQRVMSLATFQTTTYYFERLADLVNSLAHELNWLSEMKLSLKNL